jgi:hypothetical protein
MASLKERMAALQAATEAPVPKAVVAPKPKKLGGTATSFKPTVVATTASSSAKTTTPKKTTGGVGGSATKSLSTPKKSKINTLGGFQPTATKTTTTKSSSSSSSSKSAPSSSSSSSKTGGAKSSTTTPKKLNLNTSGGFQPKVAAAVVTPTKSTTARPTPKKLTIGMPGGFTPTNNKGMTTPAQSSSASNSNSNSTAPNKNKPIDLHAPTQPKFGKVGTAVVTPEKPKDTTKQDWDYLYELAVQYDNYKLQEAEEKKNPPLVEVEMEPVGAVKKDIKASLGAILGENYTAKGDWLNDEFITKHLMEDHKLKCLTFRFVDPKLFKRFDKTDETNRKIIVTKFVQALVSHPRSKDITNLHLSNCLLPDVFLQVLADTIVVQQPSKNLLGKVQVLNLEGNVLGEAGMIALSQLIANDQVWRYLQILRLENQKDMLSSEGEHALAAAILQSPSLAVVSLSVRGGLERQQINNTVAANIDAIRQARREHAAKEGTLKERKRNEMELYFDAIAANDNKSIKAGGDTVDLVGNLKFLSLNAAEKTKSGAAFATNTNIKTVKMVKLNLDDDFCVALGKSLETNCTIEKLLLDSNCFSGAGIKAIFAGLAKNPKTALVEVQVRHQSKTMASTEEEELPKLLEPNTTILKLGVDLRNQLAKTQLEKKASVNREYQRKQRLAAGGGK